MKMKFNGQTVEDSQMSSFDRSPAFADLVLHLANTVMESQQRSVQPDI